jgi:hypothetical protein
MSLSVGVSGGVGTHGGYGASGGVGVSGGIGVSSNVGIGVSSNVGVGVGVSGGVGVGVSGGSGYKSSGGSVGVSVSSPSVDVNINAGVVEDPNTTLELSESLRCHSVCAVCILCKTPAHTNAEPAYNILNCLFAYFCTEFWCCYMCFKRKDWNCWNCRHSCGNCGKYIDTYSSC